MGGQTPFFDPMVNNFGGSFPPIGDPMAMGIGMGMGMNMGMGMYGGGYGGNYGGVPMMQND